MGEQVPADTSGARRRGRASSCTFTIHAANPNYQPLISSFSTHSAGGNASGLWAALRADSRSIPLKVLGAPTISGGAPAEDRGGQSGCNNMGCAVLHTGTSVQKHGEKRDSTVLSTSQSRVQPGTIACVAAGVVVTKQIRKYILYLPKHCQT